MKFSASILAVALVTPVLAQTPSTKRLDAAIDRALNEHRIVGTVVLVAKDGKLVYHRAAGFADREAKRPMREDALFRLASMSKPIVSVAALRLVDQGKLSLDAPITRWLPYFRPKLGDGTAPAITVRHLLTHTSGLGYGFFEADGGPYHRAKVSDGMDLPGISLDENLRRLASVPLYSRPGTRWQYSLSTDVLGAVVAKASGTSLPQAVSQLVTRPLRMRETGFWTAQTDRLATPYYDGKPAPVRMTEEFFAPFGTHGVHFAPARALDRTAYPSGGAGMVGSAYDYLKFLEAVRRNGAPLLKAGTGRALAQDQLKGQKPDQVNRGWSYGFLSSVLVNQPKAATPQAPGTLSWGGAYGHTWFVDRKAGLTVVILTNTAFEGMSGQFPNWIRDAAYGK